MATTTLVRDYREAGWEFLRELKVKQFPYRSAYWRFLPDSESWRFYIATDLVDSIGIDGAYGKLVEIMREMDHDLKEVFSVLNVTLKSPNSEDIQVIERRYGKMKPDRQLIRRIEISPEEAYVYQLD
jgi:hypothetical protein